MALALAKEVGSSGVVANYWRISTVTFDFQEAAPSASGEADAPGGQVRIRLVGYANLAARLADKDPVPSASYEFGVPFGEVGPFLAAAHGDLRAAVYLAARADPYFDGADGA